MKIQPVDFKKFDLPERVYNPSLIRTSDEYWLMIATHRMQYKPVMHVEDWQENYPVFTLLRNDMSIVCSHNGKVTAIGKRQLKKDEDFRFFMYGGECFSNFDSILMNNGRNDTQRIGKIILSAHNSLIDDVIQPQPDFPMWYCEKNWSYFEHKGELHFIYKAAPNWHICNNGRVHGQYSTCVKIPVDFGIASEHLTVPTCSPDPHVVPVALSTNPIVWSDESYAVIVHTNQPLDRTYDNGGYRYARFYRNWMVLFSRETLLPTYISECFLDEEGTEGEYKEIIFVCGMVADREDVIITAGLGDTYSAYVRVPKTAFQFTKIG